MDKRTFQRLPVDLPIRFLNLDSTEEGQGRVMDISAKGVGLITKKQLAVQAPLEMWLDIPERGTPLYVRGEVIWTQPIQADKYRAGINLERADLMGISPVLWSRHSK